MSGILPAPCDLGAPSRFTSWRNGQDLALSRLLDTLKRFPAHAAPTGIGKSLIAVVWAVLTGKRLVYLTSTKGLQDQLQREFSELGIADVRGMQNYPCRALIEGVWPEALLSWRATQGQRDPTTEDGPCMTGSQCGFKDGGCPYFDAVKRARKAQIVVTNYSYWLAAQNFSEGLGDFDAMVCDEAHELPDELSAFLRVEIRDWDLNVLGYPMAWPSGRDHQDWRKWAHGFWEITDRKAATLYGVIGKRRDYRRMAGLARQFKVIENMGDDWISEKTKTGWTFEPLWPAKYAEDTLFRGIEQVAFFSATMRQKTMDLLGVPVGDREFYEYPSPFPAGRRPVIHVPTVRVNHRTDPTMMRYWVARIDQIIGGRLDRKGIIHTVSYDRAKFVQVNSEYAPHMFLHSGANTRQVVEEFKRAPAPAVLVSPSVSTGYDFPYDACEYQIIGKLAFPDTRSAIMEARCAADKDYSSYLAMIQLVQASGRGMRAPDDICETFIIDDNFGWFMAKYRGFAPDWFLRACRRSEIIPPPPEKL